MNDKTYWTVVAHDSGGGIFALFLGASDAVGYVDSVRGTGELANQFVERFSSRKAARAYAASRTDEPTARAYRLGPPRENKSWIVVRTGEFGDCTGAWSGAENYGSDAIVEFPLLNLGETAVFNSRKLARAFRQYRADMETAPGIKYVVEGVDV